MAVNRAVDLRTVETSLVPSVGGMAPRVISMRLGDLDQRVIEEFLRKRGIFRQEGNAVEQLSGVVDLDLNVGGHLGRRGPEVVLGVPEAMVFARDPSRFLPSGTTQLVSISSAGESIRALKGPMSGRFEDLMGTVNFWIRQQGGEPLTASSDSSVRLLGGSGS